MGTVVQIQKLEPDEVDTWPTRHLPTLHARRDGWVRFIRAKKKSVTKYKVRVADLERQIRQYQGYIDVTRQEIENMKSDRKQVEAWLRKVEQV